MTSRPLGKQSIVIKRAPLVVDARDNTPYRDWANATSTTVNNCMVEPFPLAEKLNFEDSRDREYSETSVRIYAPPDTDVVYTDRIEWNGHTFQVLGHPGLWTDLNGKASHRAIIAKIKQG